MSGNYPPGYNNNRGNFNSMVGMNMVGYNQQTGIPIQSVQQGIGNMGPTGIQSPSHVQQSPNPHQTLVQQQLTQQVQGPQLNLSPSTNTVSSSMVQSSMNPTHHQTQAPQQPTQTNMVSTVPQPQMPQKEINTVSLTKLGQETVQDITSRFQEIFSALKTIQPTTGNRENSAEKKVQEYFRTIRLLFKRVRIIYEKSNDGCSQGMEYTNVESLIPYKDEPDHRTEPAQCEEYKKILQENRELIETVMLKNKQLREIIDRTRIIIWEINTMLKFL
ncbi:mediator of RNA polymerase II transcription subunit 30 isoform X2 [Condylostylus longicornis]|uniref:mediator of RNA polymerase II transcription subunit 30 isoform X2 n=1 Tax=Condylostylus longicornis TaxID=2530218 RepID=UPI00244DEFA0|nr:mediator of RNA polymerase II transcription subunit 30 isoform X2 [Condylostylus longicornis]